MRTGGRFRMVLHAEDGQFFVAHPFNRVVIQIDVTHFDIFRQRLGIDRESMVLCGDCDLAAFQILHRLIRTAMAEFQFER